VLRRADRSATGSLDEINTIFYSETLLTFGFDCGRLLSGDPAQQDRDQSQRQLRHAYVIWRYPDRSPTAGLACIASPRARRAPIDTFTHSRESTGRESTDRAPSGRSRSSAGRRPRRAAEKLQYRVVPDGRQATLSSRRDHASPWSDPVEVTPMPMPVSLPTSTAEYWRRSRWRAA